MSPEPDVPVPFPSRYGTPPCPNEDCGYRCGCCCFHDCQTPCPTGTQNKWGEQQHGDDCDISCHGGHEPWDCEAFSTRYLWAIEKSKLLELQLLASSPSPVALLSEDTVSNAPALGIGPEDPDIPSLEVE